MGKPVWPNSSRSPPSLPLPSSPSLALLRPPSLSLPLPPSPSLPLLSLPPSLFSLLAHVKLLGRSNHLTHASWRRQTARPVLRNQSQGGSQRKPGRSRGVPTSSATGHNNKHSAISRYSNGLRHWSQRPSQPSLAQPCARRVRNGPRPRGAQRESRTPQCFALLSMLPPRHLTLALSIPHAVRYRDSLARSLPIPIPIPVARRAVCVRACALSRSTGMRTAWG